jgi:diadenosine tetraphosphate (Ap4A) HIT family hydrolase
MKCPICLWKPENSQYRFLFETGYWRIVLAPNQSLIGRCVVHLKRHCGDLIELTQQEFIEWFEVVKTLEIALRSAFGASMFNWSCYMNHAFRNNPPNPHIHWWAVPRYNHKVEIAEWVFDDPSFGNPYDHNRWLEVPEEIQQEITERIKQEILLLSLD